ncbi:M23 family metallopeptidase [Streptomyces sp. 891-h]|uniref:M23 family metallopeptidase n=1 Tax=Streptomyces sp. 891-h TaxID=2720714 RepID=UPI001FAB2353|nr:M23 family metallopeptidase [Streptomyces sp. 891-h]
MVNDRHPSGVPDPDDPGSGFSYGSYNADYGQSAYGAYSEDGYQAGSYDGYPTGGYDTSGGSYADGSYTTYGDDDPLFGTLPGTDTGSYPTASWEATTAWGTGSYAPDAMAAAPHVPAQNGPGLPTADDGTGQWTFGVQEAGGWDSTTWGTGGWETAGTETAGWTTDGQGAAYGYESQDGYAGQDGYGGYEHAAYDAHAQTASPYDGYAPQHGSLPDSGGYAPYEGHAYEGHGAYASQGVYDSQGVYEDQDAYEGQGGYEGHESYEGLDSYSDPGGHGQRPGHGQDQDTTAQWDFSALTQDEHGFDPAAADFAGAPAPHDAPASHEASAPDSEWDGPDEAGAPAALGTVGGPHGRGRRRSPKPRPRRRALMTVAVPSVAVMGVAGAAAASVMGDDGKDKDTTTVAAPDAAPVKPSSVNSKLDTQLQSLSADADDFADRASRTQERIDLKQRQEAEKERKAREAARKEAMRPKFVIPVKDHTLSARYGQAGVNWMSIHTGIDFPVSYGTPVMAATDGTVTTKHDVSYGNMAVVTAKDGTQTWYCHLSSNKIRSGEVKAGDVIAYSGNSGNSTGPHLHFEVHPGGGSAVDPIPWLQSKGLNIS